VSASLRTTRCAALRPLCFCSAVARLGSRYGWTDGAKGKKVIVEHTSSNPNAPLHIGNLRNVMIGAHLARLLEAVGYDVCQAFYVNDLGAQVSRAFRRIVSLHG
jgi:arginyl-tRNA synthetase